MMNQRAAFVAFVAIGGFASAVNFTARILIDRVTSYEWAVILAFPIATATAFVLNRIFVFRQAERAWAGQLTRFLIVNVVALAQVFAISVAFARYIFPAIGMDWYPDMFAHAIGLASPILTSYWMHKHFTFRPRATARLDMSR